MNDKTHQRQLLKSTGIIGGSQFMVMLIALVKNKLFSVILGSAGIGLIGIFNSVLDFIKSVSTLGLQVSGVKYIAGGNLSDNKSEQALMITSFRLWTFITAVAATFISIIASPAIDRWLGLGREGELRMVSFALFFSILATGNITIMQALKQVSAYARSNIVIAIVTMLMSVLLAMQFGVDSVVWILLSVSVISFVTSAYFLRNVMSSRYSSCPEASLTATLKLGRPMIMMGLLTVYTGLISTGSAFLIKAMIVRLGGIEQGGVFQAAWAIAYGYVGVIITAMATDLFPRLSESDGNDFSSIINSQMRLAFILMAPVVTGLIVYAPIAIPVLYSTDFAAAAPLLQWLMLAFYMKAVTMTMSYALLARVRRKLFLAVETIYYIPFLAISWWGYPRWGISSVGIGCVAAYVVYTILMFLITFRTQCTLKRTTIITGVGYSVAVISAFILTAVLPEISGYAAGTTVLLLVSIFSLREIRSILKK